MAIRSALLGALLLLLILTCALRGSPATPATDVLVVLAGGVGDDGRPHETVMRRLQRAAALYSEQQPHPPSVVCNGGGTTHKPKWVDASGYAVPEAALMGKQLITMGVRSDDVYVEGYSDDTIGNAFFLRVMHADPRPDWTRLRVITSRFQMKRTVAIYDWVFALQPLPMGKPKYELSYEAVEDEGAVPDRVLRSRRRRENTSLRSFLAGDIVRLTRLSDVHAWLYRRHSGYTADGYLSKRPLDRASALADSY